VIGLRDGSVVLGGRPVLRGVDVAVGSGEVVAVLGANGSGKSTLVRAVLGLVPLARGEVQLFGTPLAQFRDWHRLGYVPQRADADSGVPASVREVVSTGRLAHRRPWQRMSRADRESVRQAIVDVGLGDRAGDAVATLSGGQQQRALIARALAGAPEVLLLDEPMAGVDVVSQEILGRLLATLRASGTSILLVAHELGPLEPLIERTVVMRDGRVAYDGAPLPSFQQVPDHHHTHDADLRRQHPHGLPAGHHMGITPPFAGTASEEDRA
jgi:zinc transport system ATP-binding protein